MKENTDKLIFWFDAIGRNDKQLVGGKNANLGEMYQNLSQSYKATFLGEKIEVPFGFAVSTAAYRYFITANQLSEKIAKVLDGLDLKVIKNLEERSKEVQQLILNAPLPAELEKEIISAYEQLAAKLKLKLADLRVAVRSSSVDEDLSNASFAGQQESYLNIKGAGPLVEAVKKVFASLFTVRAIMYRGGQQHKILNASISVGVQKMARSDIGSSGIMFTMDTENGFDNLVLINASYGLGEMVTKGAVTPDEYKVFKSMLGKGTGAVLEKFLGSKEKKLVCSDNEQPTKQLPVGTEARHTFALTDEQIVQLAKWALIVENYFAMPMDIEWAYDGEVNSFFIVQARPQTALTKQKISENHEYLLLETGQVLAEGMAVGKKIASGKAHFISSVSEMDKFKAGEILIAEYADADWAPLIKIAAAVVTDKGGRASHAAIISREFGVPAVVGTGKATTAIKDGEILTVSCAQGQDGKVYKGNLKFKIKV
jgi:pyruvate,water dikinase